MTVPPGATTAEQAAEIAQRLPCDCDWSAEIEGCPHREWCTRMTPLGVIKDITDLAAPLIAAAERDRWRPLLKQIYDAAIEGGKSPAEVRHRIINILDDAGAFGGGPFADLLDGAP